MVRFTKIPFLREVLFAPGAAAMALPSAFRLEYPMYVRMRLPMKEMAPSTPLEAEIPVRIKKITK